MAGILSHEHTQRIHMLLSKLHFGQALSPSEMLKSRHNETAINVSGTSKGRFDHTENRTGWLSIRKNSGKAIHSSTACLGTTAKAWSQGSSVNRAAVSPIDFAVAQETRTMGNS